ncbi:MAG: hypothetical protein ACJ74J_06135 [Blastocatellia bacterium]
MKAWREKNIERLKQYDEEYRETHREQRREYNRQWREQNRDYWRGYQNQRLRTDLNYRLHNYISAALRKALKKNCRSTFELLGYSTDDLRQHLELLFQPGMSWENYGTLWHIDHVIPKSWFSIETDAGLDEYELKACWSLQNLQPLTADENLKKKDRHISHLQLGELRISYERFRMEIEHRKQQRMPFALSHGSPSH